MSSRPSLEGCWVDQSIGEPNTHLKLKERFQGVSSRIEKWNYFDSNETFLEFLNANRNANLVVIMSGRLFKTLHVSNSQVNLLHSIYVFCGNPSKYQSMVTDDSKLKGVLSTEDELYDKLRRDLQ